MIRSFTVMVVVLFALAGCGDGFRTDYPAPIASETSQVWQLADVRVVVPEGLTVSEAASLLPRADIVWREDPLGDRKPQIAAILADAVRKGSVGLDGKQAVRIELAVVRFHAMTFQAETRLRNSGVHDIRFVAQVVDAGTGAVLAGPDLIQASLPAKAGVEMATARARGETQKSQITSHVAAVIAGWLGIGPDPRGSFSRLGG